MVPIIVRLSLATLCAILGGLAAIAFGRSASRRILPLVFIALGTLLAVTLFDVLPDAKESLSWPLFLVAAGSGYLVFAFISRYLYSICPACAAPSLDPDCSEQGHVDHGIGEAMSRLNAAVWLLTAALAVHCTVDGLAIVVGDRLSNGLDVPVLLAVSIHKIPEGMALALFLLSAGRCASSALLGTVLVELATLAGGLVGARFLTQESTFWLALVFAHVGGGFLYLIVTTLRGFLRGHTRGNRPVLWSGGLAFTVTALLFLTIHEHVR